MWGVLESAERLHGVEVEGDADERFAVCSPPGSLPTGVVYQSTMGLVAGPRKIERCSDLPATPISRGDRNG